MNRLHFYSLSAILFSSLFSLNPVSDDKKEVILTCSVTNCEKVDSVFLFEFNGINFNKIQSAAIQEDKVSFSIPMSAPKFVYVGLKESDVRPVIVGTEKEIGMDSDCTGFRSAKINISDLNQQYEAFKFKMTAFANETGVLARKFQQSVADEAVKADLTAKFADLDQRKLDYRKELQNQNPYLAKIFELNTYLSFQNHGKKYANEVDYFASEYYQLVDWNDADLNNMPWVYESLKNFSTTVSSLQLPKQQHLAYLQNILGKINPDSRTYQLALSGIIAGLEQKEHENFGYFADIFAKKYEETMPEAVAMLQEKSKRRNAFSPGGEAPDFTMSQLDDTPLSLSDFKGKVTLVDFWASWCGPCRRENPHVVELYNKYHEKGFEILGVSLDRTKDRWENAIQQDGLIWKHVSDLKGWQNAAAQMYGVRSIPHTILLDRDGKIIARGLRGGLLDAKLQEIFGF